MLSIVAHADDNAIGLGGIEAMLARSGCEITTVVITDQGGRKREELRANQRLGIGKTIFLPFVDGELDMDQVEPISHIMREKIIIPYAVNGTPIDAILSMGISLTGHHDHLIASLAAQKSFIETPSVKTLTNRYMSNAERDMWNRDYVTKYGERRYFVPIPSQEHIPAQELYTGSVSSIVVGAIQEHASQYDNDGFKHVRRREELGDMERYGVIWRDMIHQTDDILTQLSKAA